MKTIRNSLILGLIFGVIQVAGNPIVILDKGTFYKARKEAELCVVVLDDTDAHVSIYVEYQLSARSEPMDSYYLYVVLPVFVEKGLFSGDFEAVEDISARIELDGVTNMPDEMPMLMGKNRAEFGVPDGVDVLYFRFRIELGYGRESVDFVASYLQPLIGGSFYYLPLFEDGNYGPEHMMEIIVPDRRLVALPESSELEWGIFESRLRTGLRHGRIIEVAVDERNSKGMAE